MQYPKKLPIWRTLNATSRPIEEFGQRSWPKWRRRDAKTLTLKAASMPKVKLYNKYYVISPVLQCTTYGLLKQYCIKQYFFNFLKKSGFNFIDGGVTCTADMVTKLTSVPDDIEGVTCALIPDALIEEMKENGQHVAVCLLGNQDCHHVEGRLRPCFSVLFDIWCPIEMSHANRFPICLEKLYMWHHCLTQTPGWISKCLAWRWLCAGDKWNVWTGGGQHQNPVVQGNGEPMQTLTRWYFNYPTSIIPHTIKPGKYDLNGITVGYGFESGDGCATVTPIEVVSTIPATLDNFSCKIMTPEVFADIGDDLIVRNCIAEATCNMVPTRRLTDKSQWQGWATGVLGWVQCAMFFVLKYHCTSRQVFFVFFNHMCCAREDWPVSSAYDDQITQSDKGYYHSRYDVGEFLQVGYIVQSLKSLLSSSSSLSLQSTIHLMLR